MHDLGFKFNSKERPGLSGNRFFEIKKITFSSESQEQKNIKPKIMIFILLWE